MLKLIVIILYSLFFNSSVNAQTSNAYYCNPNFQTGFRDLVTECSNANTSFASSCGADPTHFYAGSASIVITDIGVVEGISVSNAKCLVYACLNSSVVVAAITTGSSNGVNFGTNCPGEEEVPPTIPPTIITTINTDPTIRCGSVIQTSNQVVGEFIPLTGLPFSLSHFSSRVIGRIGDYTMKYSVNSSVVPSNVTGYNLKVKDSQNNVLIDRNFNKDAGQNYNFYWNGSENGIETWASVNRNMTLKTLTSSGAIADQFYSISMGSLKAKKLGLGGWLPNTWHFYDSVAEKVYDGDGNTRNIKAVQEGIYNRVASSDGSEVYYFDSVGRIALTRTGLTGSVLYTFGYDQLTEKLLNITDAFNNVTKFKYDSNGNLAQIVSPENIKTNFTVDSNGYLKTVTNPKNETYSMTYKDAGGLLASFTKPNGVQSTFSYDNLGNLLTDLNSGGQSSTLSKTANGINAVSTLGRITQNNFDPKTNSEIEIRPSGLATTYVHAPDVESVTNVISVTKSNITSDPRFGNQVLNYSNTQTTNFGTSTTNVVNEVNLNDLTNPFAIGTLDKTIAEGNSEITSHYDGLTRTNTFSTKLGRTFATQLDSLERPVLEQSGNILPKKYIYQNDLLSSVVQGDRKTTLTYNPSTKLLGTVKNALNQEVNYYYDNAQRLSAKKLPDGRVVNFQYDSNNNLVSITPPGRPAHKFNYGATEQLSSYLPPVLSGVANVNTLYSYSKDKELVKIARPDGQEINFNYNSTSGLLASITGSFGVISREYQNEQLTKITDQYGQVARLGYTGSVVSSLIMNNYQYQRTPSNQASGLVGSESISAGNKSQGISYFYDDDKFLTKAGDLNLEYNSPNGKMIRTSLENIIEYYTYNKVGEVKSYKAVLNQSNKEKLLYSYELSRDKLGRIVKKLERFSEVENLHNDNDKDKKDRDHDKDHDKNRNDENKLESEYLYDNAGRLIHVHAFRRNSNYEYDLNSNRIHGHAGDEEFNAIYDNQDRLIRFNQNVFSYNPNGEVLSKSELIKCDKDDDKKNKDKKDKAPSYVNTAYQYDVFGNLKAAGIVTYKIDPLQRRSARSVNGVITNQYAYNPEGQLIAELDAQGDLLKTFIYASKS
ncbi:MAG: RHS repeat protein, partial [Bacteriovorax sp.]|nr:RHS repeat protein [Bacteriovorax sp.]